MDEANEVVVGVGVMVEESGRKEEEQEEEGVGAEKRSLDRSVLGREQKVGVRCRREGGRVRRIGLFVGPRGPEGQWSGSESKGESARKEPVKGFL